MGGCLLVIGIVVMVFWLLGFIVLDLGALIHIALVIGVIFIILWLLKSVFKLILTIPAFAQAFSNDSNPSGRLVELQAVSRPSSLLSA